MGLPQPEVVWSTSYVWQGNIAQQYRIEGIFTESSTWGNYWLIKDQYTGHGFTLKLSTCKMAIVGVRIKNINHVPRGFTRPTRATQSFRVSGVLRDSGPWEQLLEEEFENPMPYGAPAPTLQTLYFKEAVEVQFLRFDLDSYWGDVGGGLAYFSVISVSGNLCLILVQLFSNRFVPIN